nr:14532_t:CDS:2 [Entrophospora candida]
MALPKETLSVFSEQESDDIQQLKCQLLEKENQIKVLEKTKEITLQTTEFISTTQSSEIPKPETTICNPVETLNPEVTSKPIVETPIIIAKPTVTEFYMKISEDMPKLEKASKIRVKFR